MTAASARQVNKYERVAHSAAPRMPSPRLLYLGMRQRDSVVEHGQQKGRVREVFRLVPAHHRETYLGWNDCLKRSGYTKGSRTGMLSDGHNIAACG